MERCAEVEAVHFRVQIPTLRPRHPSGGPAGAPLETRHECQGVQKNDDEQATRVDAGMALGDGTSTLSPCVNGAGGCRGHAVLQIPIPITRSQRLDIKNDGAKGINRTSDVLYLVLQSRRGPDAWRDVQADRFSVGALNVRVHLPQHRIMPRNNVDFLVFCESLDGAPSFDHTANILDDCKENHKERGRQSDGQLPDQKGRKLQSNLRTRERVVSHIVFEKVHGIGSQTDPTTSCRDAHTLESA